MMKNRRGRKEVREREKGTVRPAVRIGGCILMLGLLLAAASLPTEASAWTRTDSAQEVQIQLAKADCPTIDPSGIQLAKTGLSKGDSSGIQLPKIDLPKIDLPEIDFSKFDGEKEKEKLRDALKELDEKGLSAEKIAERIWGFVTRPENREKIGETADAVREKAEEITGRKEKPESDSVKASDSATAEENSEIDRITQKVTEEASEEVGKAVDRAAGTAAEKAKEAVSEEIDRAAENLKDSLR